MPSRPNRIDYLDGIRALAVLAVVAVHWLPQYLPDWLPILRGGYIGVDLFLILSGYLITRILWRSPVAPIHSAYGKFLKRRFWRLYPALVGMLVVVTLIMFLVGRPVDGGTGAWRALVAGLQLTPIVTVLDLDAMSPFKHTWTLGWEWYFYLVWPLILLALRNRRVSALDLAVGSTVVALLFYAVSVAALSTPMMYHGPLGRFSQILAGAALGLYFIARPAPLSIPPYVRNFFMVGALTAISAWTIVGPHQNDRLYGVLGFPLVTVSGMVLIAIGYGRETDAVPRILAWTPIKSIGLWSYSIYLWHVAALDLLSRNMFGLPQPVLAVIGVVATVVFVSLSYRYLEKPFLRGKEPVTQDVPSTQEGSLSR
jgi:peptidoglycan/LPS O-acetylase OafA/YrhL